jgi:hypothetical protein
MSRSGYSDDCDWDDQWGMIRWRGAVASAMNGKRGQEFLKELLAALDAMPERRLLAVTINSSEGCCTLGCVTKARGIDTSDLDQLDPYDDYGDSASALAKRLGIASAMSKEIVFMNDEGDWQGNETPEQRWQRMRDWVASKIASGAPGHD